MKLKIFQVILFGLNKTFVEIRKKMMLKFSETVKTFILIDNLTEETPNSYTIPNEIFVMENIQMTFLRNLYLEPLIVHCTL